MKIRCLAFALAACLTLAAGAQTLTITNGVQKYASLTSTTVNMSGTCELWVTNSTTPLSGCTVNLNYTNAWLFLPGVKASVVASTYLGQVRVNGAVAVADSNVRVVQYGQSGAVVIPHSAAFKPLTVFGQAQFGGTSVAYNQWTYYIAGGIAPFSSFKLQRGYQAVFAQTANGKNYSKCYVAQDGDLEVGVLPSTLDKQVQFIYVTPWRWMSKKGIAGDPGIGLINVLWWYNWNLNSSSSRDLEYLAIRQNQFWPGLSQNWHALGVNTLLGYNEPDSASQANMSVSTAIGAWGDLLATGLRVGSPATTDGGRSGWLYPFVSQADAAGLRVDFVAAHYYQGHNPADASGAASQMYNFLLDIWNNTHRPIWVTEWNNGANWTDNNPWPAPTYAQQQACIAAMVNMLETTPFVERYALYNWVEDVRSVVTNGAPTPAGVTYSNQVSNLSYTQAMPDNGPRGIAQYLFATNTLDTSGYYNNAMAVGAPAYAAGHNAQAQAIVLDAANSYVQLPANIARGSAFTFAGWVYWNGGGNWQRIFDFGNDTSHYLFLTPSSGSGTLRFAINNGGGEQIVQTAGPLAAGSWQHVAITLNGNTAILYVNGAQVASSTSFSIAPSAFSPIKNYLGRSQFPADPFFNGKLDEVEIADYAMSATQIAVLYNSALYPSFTSGVWTNNAGGNWGESNNWSGGLIANGISRMADFSTINLPSDCTVTLDSPRTIGGLRFGDTSGSQNWTLTGSNTLTLDGGSPNMALIAVNQNAATTISTPLAGNNGLAKNGNGTLILNGTNAFGGSLFLNAGALNVTEGADTFGGLSYVGHLTGSGILNMTGGSLTNTGELRVGGSDQNGAQFNATGTVILSNATLSVGALSIARGNNPQNTVSGTVTLNSGSTLNSEGDVLLDFAGGVTARLIVNGGTLNLATTTKRWLIMSEWDSGSAQLEVNSGQVNINANTDIRFATQGNSGTNTFNLNGGAVTFYSDNAITVGGSGVIDLHQGSSSTVVNIFNLNGGLLTVSGITSANSAGTRTFNFNAGALKATASTATFMNLGTGNAVANVRNGGAIIHDGGFDVSVAQPLVHSTIAGDNAIDGGLTKLGSGTLTLTGANTYNGNTTVQAGTLELSLATLATNSTVSISNGALLRLDFAGTNTVAGLVLNGLPQPPGIYNSSTASPYITGSGSLLVPTGSNPTNITFAVSGSTLQLSWPQDHLGWILQSSTNLSSPSWADLPGSASLTSTNITISPNNPAEFFRLRHP
jgi:autotransporter-associated beta strand protein